LCRQVREHGVEVGVRLGRVTALDALLELVGLEPPGEVLLAKDVGDRFTVAISGSQATVVWSLVGVEVGSRLGHLRFLPSGSAHGVDFTLNY
jgi:hypothetical protein